MQEPTLETKEIAAITDIDEHKLELVNISGIDKSLLMRLLWENATNQYNVHNIQYNEQIAKKQLRDHSYADYICGRPIKVDIYTGDLIDSTNYNINNGVKKLENIINYIRHITLHVNEKYNGPEIIDSEAINSNIGHIDFDNIDPKVLAEAKEMLKEMY